MSTLLGGSSVVFVLGIWIPSSTVTPTSLRRTAIIASLTKRVASTPTEMEVGFGGYRQGYIRISGSERVLCGTSKRLALQSALATSVPPSSFAASKSEKLATCPLDLDPLHWILSRRGHLHKVGGLHARWFGNEVVIAKFEVTNSSEGWRRWRSRDVILKGLFWVLSAKVRLSPNRVQREK